MAAILTERETGRGDTRVLCAPPRSTIPNTPLQKCSVEISWVRLRYGYFTLLVRVSSFRFCRRSVAARCEVACGRHTEDLANAWTSAPLPTFAKGSRKKAVHGPGCQKNYTRATDTGVVR